MNFTDTEIKKNHVVAEASKERANRVEPATSHRKKTNLQRGVPRVCRGLALPRVHVASSRTDWLAVSAQDGPNTN